MIYTLPKTFKGAKVIDFTEIREYATSIVMNGLFGTLNTKGDFVNEPALARAERNMTGREHAAFIADAHAKGAPEGDYRHGDMSDWLTAWGYTGNGEAWYKAHPEPKPEPVG